MKETKEKQQATYALVTGASRGLGAEISRQLAGRGYNLLLVSLPGERLASFAGDLGSSFKIKAYYYETDFMDYSSVYQVADWAMQKGPISVLINNAGTGGTRHFGEATPEYIDNIIQTNIRTTSMLTRLLLPELKKNRKAYVLNISSMASFSPVAYKTVYPASKAFVWSFSRGLYEELKNTNVFVSVIHPGPMKTNADVTKRIERQGFFGKFGLLSAGETASIALNGLFRKDTLMIPGSANKINWVLTRITPVWLRLKLLSAVVKRELPEDDLSSDGIQGSHMKAAI